MREVALASHLQRVLARGAHQPRHKLEDSKSVTLAGGVERRCKLLLVAGHDGYGGFLRGLRLRAGNSALRHRQERDEQRKRQHYRHPKRTWALPNFFLARQYRLETGRHLASPRSTAFRASRVNVRS